jgi:GNAT superfamily N-acetyltransferase
VILKNMNLEIKYDLPDKTEYFTLFESTGWNQEYKASPGLLLETLMNSWFFVTVCHNSKLIGSGRVISDGYIHALILDMIVLPNYKGCGIGTTILKILVNRCLQYGINDIQLFCAKGKKKFYSQHGFVERPVDSPGMDFKNQK